MVEVEVVVGAEFGGRQEGGAHEKAPPDGLPNFSEICVE